jgi:uncharacterized protein YodC (DUF2158 family)
MTPKFRVGDYVKQKQTLISMRIGEVNNFLVINKIHYTGLYRCYWTDLYSSKFYSEYFYERELQPLFYNFNTVNEIKNIDYRFSKPMICLHFHNHNYQTTEESAF